MVDYKRHLNIAGALLLFIGFSLNSFHLHRADLSDHSDDSEHVVIVEDVTTCPVCTCLSTLDITTIFSTFSPFIPETDAPVESDFPMAEAVNLEKSSRGPPFLIYMNDTLVVNRINPPSYERTLYFYFHT